MSEKADDWISAGRAAKRLGVSTRTLRRYTLEGVLEDRRSPGGRRIFRVGDLDALSRRRGEPLLPTPGGVVLYGRVSSHGQRAEGDLDRQMSRLREAAKGRIVIGEYSDVASGLSDRRRGLRRALLACQAENVSVLLVTHEERLARFGTAMLAEAVLPSWGVRLEIAGGDEAGDGDLARDMLAIVTSFSGRLYGARSAKARAVVRAVKSTVDEGNL